MSEQSTPWDDDLSFALTCAALRYAVTRRSYACSVVADAIRTRLHLIDATQLSRMVDELTDVLAEREYPLDQIDAGTWNTLRREIVNELRDNRTGNKEQISE